MNEDEAFWNIVDEEGRGKVSALTYELLSVALKEYQQAREDDVDAAATTSSGIEALEKMQSMFEAVKSPLLIIWEISRSSAALIETLCGQLEPPKDPHALLAEWASVFSAADEDRESGE